MTVMEISCVHDFGADCDADQHNFESDTQYSDFDGPHVDPNVKILILL